MTKKGQDIQERTLEFACLIVQLCDYLSKRRGTARTMSRQLLRSGTAVGALLQEADAAESTADFISKCTIALKEARESHYWLRVLRRSNVVPAAKVDTLVNESNEIVAIVTTIVRNTRTGRSTDA